MEISALTKLERILIATCFLIIAPAFTTPAENSELNTENKIQVPRFHYSSEDTSQEDLWNYNFPRISIPLQEKSQETKRRSSFFPVRGKKVTSNVVLGEKQSAPRGFPFDLEEDNAEGKTFFPAAKRSFYGAPWDDQISAILPHHSLENADGALDLMDSQVQKRPSSFMPMRGRKRYSYEGNLEFIKQYLSSKAHDGVLNPAFKDLPLRGAGKKISIHGIGKIKDPIFHDNSQDEDANLLGQDQIEKRFNFFTGDPKSLSHEETNLKLFPNGRSMSGKRALSFVPTRGRRENPEEPVSEFSSHMAAPVGVEDWPQDFAPDRMFSNLSRYTYDVAEKIHERHRRASAFMPMRGRKSGSPYKQEYNYVPVNPLHRFGGSNGIEDIQKELPGINEIQERILDDLAAQRQKRNFDRAGMQSSFPPQKLRTALVMKRPLSFFAARGKRLDVNGTDAV